MLFLSSFYFFSNNSLSGGRYNSNSPSSPFNYGTYGLSATGWDPWDPSPSFLKGKFKFFVASLSSA